MIFRDCCYITEDLYKTPVNEIERAELEETKNNINNVDLEAYFKNTTLSDL